MALQTVKVRVIVATWVDIDGRPRYQAEGSDIDDQGKVVDSVRELTGEMEACNPAYHWIEVDVPLPVNQSVPVIAGARVEAAP